MKIGVIGTGYVGLVSAVCLSDFGHTIICYDINPSKIKILKKGECPIYEPGLDLLLKKNIEAKRLVFVDKMIDLVADVDVIFIAVGTPQLDNSEKPNLTALYSVCDELRSLCKHHITVVIKSTVPVGTNKKVFNLLNVGNKQNFDVISNPEFLREGSAIEDFMRPDRLIIGLRDDNAKKIITRVYKPLYLRDLPIVFTDPESAELIKYAANAFLATKIAFINEIAALSERVNADVKEVARGIGLDGRIGNKFLHAGPGFGGSCFPKDTAALAFLGKENKCPQSIVETVIKSNQRIKKSMIEKIKTILKGRVKEAIICVLGVTFKPNTDDMREAPSLIIIPELLNLGARVRVVDPKGKKFGEPLLKSVEWYEDINLAAEHSDLIVILTEWNEFRALDLTHLSKIMNVARLADLRNVYSKEIAKSNGFDEYIGVGRKK